MKKIISLILASVLLLTACSSGEASVEIDIAATAEQMKSETVLLGELIEMSEVNVEELLYTDYDAEVVAEYIVYSCASKATAEEIAIFKAVEGETDAVKAILEQRVLDLSNEYRDYIPVEMPKLENAYIDSVGEYVILVIADDTAPAVDIFHDAF